MNGQDHSMPMHGSVNEEGDRKEEVKYQEEEAQELSRSQTDGDGKDMNDDDEHEQNDQVCKLSLRN